VSVARALIGTAGWSLPRESQARFPPGDSHLARYAAVFPAVEINSTFHRPHRASTFARWAATVPAGFRFSVKLPRTITHEQRLSGTSPLLDPFLTQLEPLGERVACLLVQLPPSLELDAHVARAFLAALRERFAGDIALEPRHESWFSQAAEEMLRDERIARVAADPPRAANGLDPGGDTTMAYFRLHGSPRVYYSSYEAAFIQAMAVRLEALAARGVRCWCIFDNTTLGAGTANALALLEALQPPPKARTR
jgi:uncharacterized protein YecE (DUF72 family)